MTLKQRGHLCVFTQIIEIFRQQPWLFLCNLCQRAGNNAAVLADIKAGKMEAEQRQLATERLDHLNVHALVFFNDTGFNLIQCSVDIAQQNVFVFETARQLLTNMFLQFIQRLVYITETQATLHCPQVLVIALHDGLTQPRGHTQGCIRSNKRVAVAVATRPETNTDQLGVGIDGIGKALCKRIDELTDA